MQKVVTVIICLTLFSVFSVNAFGQTMFLNPSEDSLMDIQNSKFTASSINVLRNSNGELISVVKTDASKYLSNPITDQFFDILPVLEQKTIHKKGIEIKQVSIDYDYEKCITETYQIPGYMDECNWYHRAHVTNLRITNDIGERFEIFRGLNHSYIIKPENSVTSFWTIIRSD